MTGVEGRVSVQGGRNQSYVKEKYLIFGFPQQRLRGEPAPLTLRSPARTTPRPLPELMNTLAHPGNFGPSSRASWNIDNSDVAPKHARRSLCLDACLRLILGGLVLR